MENIEKSTFSAYNRICQKFLEACEEEGNLDPAECLKALCRFLIPNFATTASSPSTHLAPTGESQILLSKDQVEEAKKEARVAKAKRIGNGLTFRDVALTTQEVKEAKAAYRKKLQGVVSSTARVNTVPAPVPPQVFGGVQEVKASGSLLADKSVAPVSTPKISGKKPVGVQLPPSGLRKTQKTRIDNCRKVALQHNPAALADPCVLHVVAYCNDFVRLSNQVSAYDQLYEKGAMLNPLRGLPSPSALGKIVHGLNEAMGRLPEQSETPGTHVLQSLETGASFWEMDKPSSACPEFLRRPLTKDEIGMILDLSGASN